MHRIQSLPPLPQRPDDSHKGTFGRVLIVGGSRGMSGAACLAGLGALRGGAGLVYVAIPRGILPIVASVEPSYLTIPLPEDRGGRISNEATDELTELADKNDAVALGPGLGQSDKLKKLVAQLYRTVATPMVVDADGLNALAPLRKKLAKPKQPRILTPHPGEFARLLGIEVAEVERDRENLAASFARERGVVLVLKGHRSIITDGECVCINSTGNSGMATGGTGDVLTGLIAALLAQKMSPFEAAQLAVHVHGLAGDLAAAELSKPGLIASDLPRFVAKAWLQLEGGY